ncbi:hypothetical protein ARMSODRAFT_966825 [Armillaria solidipes]|uniref:YMC020W-like alpha/beta hydrolase domain-containing protein n=1 Tax=Armillaria solidipes TaxID=1076256 RepID=A0A2H3B6W0_9AGAR|nr:hypothetical protein ARMSODRAFT_966825 [Armillaria solidipes]
MSSRRSSHSTRTRTSSTARPPSWRTLSLSKGTAAARVSLVHAEPERGHGAFGSAIDGLPSSPKRNGRLSRDIGAGVAGPSGLSYEQKNSPSSPQESGTEEMKATVPTNSLTPIPSTSATVAPPTVPGNDQAPPPAVLVETDTSTSTPTTNPDAQPEDTLEPHAGNDDTPPEAITVPAPAQSVGTIPFPTIPSSPPRTSWFGSLGRSRGREKAKESRVFVESNLREASSRIDEDTVMRDSSHEQQDCDTKDVLEPPKSEEDKPQPLTVPEVETSAIPTPSLPQPMPSQPVDTATASRRSWFGATVSASPPSARSIPSSIDEDVPALSTSPLRSPESPPKRPRVESVSDGKRARLDSLNPSSSRFTISIPLLGRPKVPLEEAMASAPAVMDPHAQSDEPDGTDTDSTITADTEITMTTTTPATTIAAIEEAPEKAPVVEIVKEEIVVRASGTEEVGNRTSWWDYVGWGGSVRSAAAAPVQAEDLSSTIDAPAEETPSAPTVDALPAVEAPQDATPAEEPATEESHKLKPSSSSVFSSDTRASWYTPWAWYYYSTTTKSAPTGMTPSEMVKEEALARDSAESNEVIMTNTGDGKEEVLEEEVNPITSTITTNRSGWAAFFSSTSSSRLGAKRIEDVKPSGEMEVMDIDEDDSPGNSEAKDSQKQEDVQKSGQTDKPNVGSPPPSPTRTKGKDGETKREIPQLIISEDVKSKAAKRKSSGSRPPSVSSSKPPSTKSGTSTPPTASKKTSGATTPPKKPAAPRTPPPPNLVLPSWRDTFHSAPRNVVPATPQSSSRLGRTVRFLLGGSTDGGKGKERDVSADVGVGLPRAWDVLQGQSSPSEAGMGDVLRGCKRVVVIGIHGWFPGAIMRTVLGEPTGTSPKFVSMTLQALEEFQARHDVKLEKVTGIPLEGEGTIGGRVDKLYTALTSNAEWMDDLHECDALIVATHSQGSVVSTHLLDRLLREGHLVASFTPGEQEPLSPGVEPGLVAGRKKQRICCLALCGIHLGPLRYLSTSSLFQPYFQYFESEAARELFEFQNTESDVSKAYISALRNVVGHGAKMVYIASLNDQVVPLYSGLFTNVNHPLILRAVYIDGDAYHSSDFLSNLLVLLLRILNTGLSDSGLIAHLSEATAGSLNGVGHSTAYEEVGTYALAVNYLFLADDGPDTNQVELKLDDFNAATEQNDYEIPWSLRDLIADPSVQRLFEGEFLSLRDAFKEWHPKTTILRDVKRKLAPITRMKGSTSGEHPPPTILGNSKL